MITACFIKNGNHKLAEMKREKLDRKTETRAVSSKGQEIMTIHAPTRDCLLNLGMTPKLLENGKYCGCMCTA